MGLKESIEVADIKEKKRLAINEKSAEIKEKLVNRTARKGFCRNQRKISISIEDDINFNWELLIYRTPR